MQGRITGRSYMAAMTLSCIKDLKLYHGEIFGSLKGRLYPYFKEADPFWNQKELKKCSSA
jgi:hypothetical protein